MRPGAWLDRRSTALLRSVTHHTALRKGEGGYPMLRVANVLVS
jgi:hypothetical protein